MNTQLEMDFSTSNACLRSFNKIFCSWGQRKTPYDVNHQIKGQTAPLWANPSPKWFLIFFIVNLISSLLFAAIFIAIRFKTDQANKSCFEKGATDVSIAFIIIAGIALFFNSLYWLFLYLKEYANDQEWSRYLMLLAIFDVALLGCILYNFYLSCIKLQERESIVGDSCNTMYLTTYSLNIVVSIVSSILAIMMLVRTIMLSKDFFLNKHVPHTAICEDEDIVIME